MNRWTDAVSPPTSSRPLDRLFQAQAAQFRAKHPLRSLRPRVLRLDGQVLVATDGLLKYQSPQVICAYVRQSRAESLDALINILRGARGALPDDVALVCSRA